MATFSSLVIYDSVLFQRGHMIHRWANSVERRFVVNAKQAAPKRSGELAGGISGETFKSGPKHWQVHVHSDAPHTMYVLRGTTGPIMSNLGWAGGEVDERGRLRGYMRLQPGNGYGVLYRWSVSGQAANNFFDKAADATARRHPSLRGWDPAYGY